MIDQEEPRTDRPTAPPSRSSGSGRSEPVWRHSSYSQGADQTCVDVAFTEPAVAVRDSKDTEGPILCFTPREWHVFLLGVRAGEFDLPGSPPHLPGSPQTVA